MIRRSGFDGVLEIGEAGLDAARVSQKRGSNESGMEL